MFGVGLGWIQIVNSGMCNISVFINISGCMVLEIMIGAWEMYNVITRIYLY